MKIIVKNFRKTDYRCWVFVAAMTLLGLANIFVMVFSATHGHR